MARKGAGCAFPYTDILDRDFFEKVREEMCIRDSRKIECFISFIIIYWREKSIQIV